MAVDPVGTIPMADRDYTRTKLDYGGEGASTPVDATHGLPVAIISGGGSGSLPALGGATAANSLPVTTATDDPSVARTGIVTETAPATDTASSGLNGRLQRIAQRITSLIALLPTALGSGGGLKVDGSGTALPVSATQLPAALGGTTAAASLPVVLSSDGPFVTAIGIITETAPATDTASSGLNGRLQRIAQRLTSLIALVPTALGTNGGMKVELASGLGATLDSVQTIPAPGTAAIIHVNADYATAQTGTAIYTPTSGKTVVVTNCRISTQAGTTAGMVTVWMSASAANDTTYTPGTDVAIARDSFVPSATSTPGSKSGPICIPGKAANYPICVTTSAAIPCTIMLELFEV